jgi:hypothetical protein
MNELYKLHNSKLHNPKEDELVDQLFGNLKIKFDDNEAAITDYGLVLSDEFIKEFRNEKEQINNSWETQKTIMNDQWTLINNKIPKMLSKFCDKIVDDKNKLITENVNLATELQLRKIQITEYKTQIDNQNKIIAGLFEKISLLETA